MPSFLGRKPDASVLQAAIDAAKDAGVSLVDIRDAEVALGRIEAKQPAGGN